MAAHVSKKSKKPRNDCDEDGDVLMSSSQVVQAEPSSHLCDEAIKSFLSQPTSLDDMLVSTQLLNTQSNSTQNILQKLVRRMTRFTVSLTITEAADELEETLSELKLEWKASSRNAFTVSGMDRRKTPVVFKTNLMETDNGIFLDFRLSKGCGIEFKRYFVEIRRAFKQHIVTMP